MSFSTFFGSAPTPPSLPKFFPFVAHSGVEALWLDPRRSQYTDQGGTILATTNGQTILNSPDFSGAGNSLSASSNGLTYRLVNGIPVFELQPGRSLEVAASRAISAFSFVCFWRNYLPQASQTHLFGFGANGGTSLFISPRWTSGEYRLQGIATGNVLGIQHQFDDSWHSLGILYQGSQVRAWFDGVEISGNGNIPISPSPANASITATHYRLGDSSNSSGTQVAELGFLEAAIDPELFPAAHQYFLERHNALLSTAPKVVMIGDSLLGIVYGGFASSIPKLIWEGRTKSWQIAATIARGGASISSWLSRFEEIQGLIHSGDTVFLWLGTNELALFSSLYGSTNRVALSLDRAAVLIDAIRSAGAARIVVGNCLPRSTIAEGDRTGFNTGLVTLASTRPWMSIADVAANATIGAAGANTNTANYNIDAVHLNATGNAIAAPIFRAAIEAVI